MRTESSTVKIVLVVGSKSSGKTAYLRLVIRRARQHGLKVGGILSPGELQGGTKQEYFVEDVRTGQKTRLAWLSNEESSPIQVGSYSFNPRAFEMANRILRESQDADVVVLDEYGPLEKSGGGFRPALEYLLQNYSGILFIALRPSLLHHIKSELLFPFIEIA